MEIPSTVRAFLEWLVRNNYRAWIVGGAVRDWILGKKPKDWDIATDAPSKVILDSPFKTYAVGTRFGVVDVNVGDHIVEATSIIESAGSDRIEKDLERRDFTINALAISFPDGKFLDLFGGIKDLERKRLRPPKDPVRRFQEDPLRILRAARFVSLEDFHVTPTTLSAMKMTAPLIKTVAAERIREEMFRMVVGANIIEGFELLRKSGALREFFPELLEGWRKKQNVHHRYDIYHHILYTLFHSPQRLRVRLAALFHDIAKPRVRIKKNGRFRFFGHEKIGEQMTREILERWRTSHQLTKEVCILVKNHMVYNIEKWSDGAIRRLIHRVGKPLINDFLDLLKADRLAHGTDDRKSVEEVELLETRIKREIGSNGLLSRKNLAINGHDVMKFLNVGPGPLVGRVLENAFRHVLKYPEDNRKERLLELLKSGKLTRSVNHLDDGRFSC